MLFYLKLNCAHAIDQDKIRHSEDAMHVYQGNN